MVQVPKSYWARVEQVGREVYASGQFPNLDEQAGPAYFEGLSLSRWLFWRRLSLAAGHVSVDSPGRCLDFGCGFGLLLPLLREHFAQVVGVDLNPDLARAFLSRWDRALGRPGAPVEVFCDLKSARIGEGSLDLVLALDVLEHVDDLEEVLRGLHSLLRPGGILLVTGPTESRWYRLGRRLVGFSGDYHRWNIYDVLTAMQGLFEVKIVRRLPVLCPLFVFATGTRTGG